MRNNVIINLTGSRIKGHLLTEKTQDIQRLFPSVVLLKRCSTNMKQTHIPGSNFYKVAVQFYWNCISALSSLVNLLHIWRTLIYQLFSGEFPFAATYTVKKHMARTNWIVLVDWWSVKYLFVPNCLIFRKTLNEGRKKIE